MEDAPFHGHFGVVGALLTKIGPNIKEHLLNESSDLPFGTIVSIALQSISWKSEQSNATLVFILEFRWRKSLFNKTLINET